MIKRTVVGLALFASAALADPALASSLDLAINDIGLSFGNSKRFSGLRLNLVDSEVREINGVNLTFWKPDDEDNDHAVYNGFNFALIGLSGREMNGLALAGIGLSTQSANGLALALIGMSVEEEFRGIGIAGIGMGGGDFRGAFFGGIGLGTGRLEGIGVGLIGLGASEFRGIGFGGVGIGADELKGIFVGGVGAGGDELTGIGFGGVGIGGDELTGLMLGLIGVGGNELRGVFAGLVGVGGEELYGSALGGLLARFNYAEGLTTGLYNRVAADMIGVQIGLFNWTSYLKGLQIGLINYVGNNPKALRLLPIVNWHFGD